MFDRFMSSMNTAWQSTKKAVAESVEFAKDNTTRQITVSDVEVQSANDSYDQLIAAIKHINLKVELLESEFLACSQHLKSISTIFAQSSQENANEVNSNNNNNNNNNNDNSSTLTFQQQRLESVKTFEKLVRNLVDHLIPKYVLEHFVSIQKDLISLKESKDAVHKICFDMDIIKKQMTAAVTKPIVEKMHMPQKKLQEMGEQLAETKPVYIEEVRKLLERFAIAKKEAYTALMFYEQQFLMAVEKYLVNTAARPSNPPFVDYSDLTNIIPNYLQLLASKNYEEDA